MIRTGSIPRTIALALAFVLLIALVIVAEIDRSMQRGIGRTISRSQQRQVLLATLLDDVQSAQDAQRAYLLTGDAGELARFHAARRSSTPALQQLLALERQDAALLGAGDSAALAQLARLVPAELDALGAAAAPVPASPQQEAGTIRAQLASPTMRSIAGSAATLRAAEHRVILGQLARAARLRTAARALTYGIALLAAALLLVTARLLARQTRRRVALTEQLARENEKLEQRVTMRTEELSSLSSHLQRLSEKEKATLARELHDELGGLLIAVKMDVSWLLKRWPNPTAEIQARWARVLKVLDDGVDFKRRVVENLRPTLLDNMGLLPAVRWVVHESCGRAGLQYTEIYPEQEPQLTDDAAIMVFRLVQESLANVVKHAHATYVRVQLALQAQEMSVSIEDNGTGIDAGQHAAAGSHGLAIMRHRVRSCGGSLTIENLPQGGTRVCARLPLAGILKIPPPRETDASTPAAAPPPRVARLH